MRNLVNIFERTLNTNDDFVRRALNYGRALNTEDWKFLVDAIHLIKGQMSLDMFSKEYTEMTEKEKDVLQKTYYQTMLILEFLGNPQGWINRKKLYKQKLTDHAEKTSKQMGGRTW